MRNFLRVGIFIFVAAIVVQPNVSAAKELLDLNKKFSDTAKGETLLIRDAFHEDVEFKFYHMFQKEFQGYQKLHRLVLSSYCEESIETTMSRYLELLRIISNNFLINGAQKDKDVVLLTFCSKEGKPMTNGIAVLINSMNLAKINTRINDDDIDRAEGVNGKKKELVYPYRAIMLNAQIVDYPNINAPITVNSELTEKWKKMIGEFKDPGILETVIEAAYAKRLEKKK